MKKIFLWTGIVLQIIHVLTILTVFGIKAAQKVEIGTLDPLTVGIMFYITFNIATIIMIAGGLKREE